MYWFKGSLLLGAGLLTDFVFAYKVFKFVPYVATLPKILEAVGGFLLVLVLVSFATAAKAAQTEKDEKAKDA